MVPLLFGLVRAAGRTYSDVQIRYTNVPRHGLRHTMPTRVIKRRKAAEASQDSSPGGRQDGWNEESKSGPFTFPLTFYPQLAIMEFHETPGQGEPQA